MNRQERHQDAKADQGKEEVEQPGNKLEWMGRPTPTVSPGMLGLDLRSCFITRLLWSCLIRWFIADVHLQQAEKENCLKRRVAVKMLGKKEPPKDKI